MLKCFIFCAQVLKIASNLGRINSARCHYRSFTANDRVNYTISIPGRLILDIYRFIIKNFELRQNTLNHVAEKFLGERKEDVHFSEISPLFKKDSASRKRLGEYCIKDSILPMRLLEKLQVDTR